MVEKRFVWEYPYRHAVNVPSKLTVTEITKLQGLRVLQISGEDQLHFRLIGGLPSFPPGRNSWTAASVPLLPKRAPLSTLSFSIWTLTGQGPGKRSGNRWMKWLSGIF